MKILLHQCCGPCSIYPITRLLSEKADITAYFYNPNIHPVVEYYKRLDTALKVNEHFNIKYIIDEEYGLIDFVREHSGAIDERCSGCYRKRLIQTAAKAAEYGFTHFSSTLLYSKMQKHDEIIAIANECATSYNVKFYYEDFRLGWNEGIDISKELEIYRQNYCGCIFSEEDRFLKQLSSKFNKNLSKKAI